MKILLICPNVPYPPHTGESIRIFSLLKWLSVRNEVDLICIDRGGVAEETVSGLKKYCRSVYFSRWSKPSLPVQIVRIASRAIRGVPFHNKYADIDSLRRLIRETTANNSYDIVQFEHSYTASHLDCIAHRSEVGTVLALHNVSYLQFYRMYQAETNVLRKLKYFLTWYPMLSWEPQIAARFDKTVVVSETDRTLLSALRQGLDISVIPNGVDTVGFRPLRRETAGTNIIMVGTLSYQPNVDAALYFHREIFPLVKKRIPGCTLTIVGKDPKEEVLRLAADPAVRVRANVDDVRTYYRDAQVAVVALRSGGGTRLKILEAMSLGIPVVSTQVGCEGIPVTDGHDILIADDPHHFARSIAELCTTPPLAEKISRNGRELVEENFDWERIAESLEELYREIMPSAGIGCRAVPTTTKSVKGVHHEQVTVVLRAAAQTAGGDGPEGWSEGEGDEIMQ